MKKISLLFLFLSFCVVNSFGQFPSMNKAKVLKLKSRILIVAFEEQDAAVIKKQELTGADLKRYTDQIEGRNYALKSAFESYWKYNSSIQYMPYSKALELSAKEKNKYVIVRYNVPVDPKFSIKKTRNGYQIGWSKDSNGVFSYNPYTRQTHAVNKPLKIVFEMPREVAYMYLPNFFPAKSDIVYAIKTLQFIGDFLVESEKHTLAMLKSKKFNLRNDILKDMTLYVDKGDCNPPMTEKQVQELYPYNLKTVFFNNMEEAILGNDTKIAVLVPFVYYKGKGKEAERVRVNAIVNSATGELYCADCIKFKFGEYEDPINERSFNEN